MILLVVAFLILGVGNFPPAFAQQAICCNQLVNVGGGWIGASRTCDLSNASPEQRTKLCQQLAGCADAAPYCGVDRPCTETGSLIDIQNQALGERIAVSGTPFRLHYRSDRMRGGPAADSFPNSLAGWSINVHHAYETARGILYAGDGKRLIRKLTTAQRTGEIRIPSEDGRLLYVFDGNGKHVRTLNALTGAIHYRFFYDHAAGLTRIEDGNGNATRIERDGKNVPTAIVAPGGQRTTLIANQDGYLTSIINPAGEMTRLSYAKNGQLSALTDRKGQVHRFTYSNQGSLVRDENPAGGHWALARTQSGNAFRIALRSALGRTSVYEVERLATGDERRVNTGPSGATIRVETDKNGKERIIHPDGTVALSEFQPDPRWGALAPFLKSSSLSTPDGRRLTVSADRKIELAQAGNPLSLGSLTESLSINGRQYLTNVDLRKMELMKKTPAGRSTITAFDNYGRIIRQEIVGVLPVIFDYDDKGRLTRVGQGADDDARVVNLIYDAEGRVVGIVDPLKRRTRFEYDRAGRVTKQIFADGREIVYAYDPNGNLTAVTPPGQPAHNLEYTPVDLPQNYLPPSIGLGRNQTNYAYNRDKQLTRMTRADGKNVEIEYDQAGRTSSLTTPQGKTHYLFDAKTDRLKSITANDGGILSYDYDGFLPTRTTWSGTIQGDVRRAYDDDLRLTSLAINGKRPIENRYDADGLLLQAGAMTLERDLLSGSVTSSKLGNIATSQKYNRFGEITGFTVAFKEKELFAIEYERDAAGRIVKKAERAEGQARAFAYVYDLAGRLAEVLSDGTRSASYQYDRNGNRIAYKDRTGESKAKYDTQDRLVDYGGVSYRYTAHGELANKTGGGNATIYDYDARGNLRSATLAGGLKVDYVIDGVNRRIGKKLNGKLVQGFLYGDQLKPVAELDGRNNVVSMFVYGTKVNVPEYVEKSDGIYRIITDHLGSPRLVINVETGAFAQRMDYDAFGNVLQDTNPGFQPFGFAGGIYDQHTTLTRFGARDYDAATGRWTAKDPIGFAGGDVNLYLYAANNPVNRADPTGLQTSDEFGIWTGAKWSDPELTTIVDIDSAGNVSVTQPTNPVDFPLTGGPTSVDPGIVDKFFPGGQPFLDKLKKRYNDGWTIYQDGPVRFSYKGPNLNPDRYGQDDVAPSMCINPTTGEAQSQSPYNVPASPTSWGGTIRLSF